MCSRLRWISLRLRIPRTVGIKPTAVYGSGTGLSQRCEHDVVADRAPLALDTRRPFGIVGRAGYELADQRTLDREHRVRIEIVAFAIEDVRLHALVARRADD